MAVLRRINKELKLMEDDPIHGVTVATDPDDVLHLTATLECDNNDDYTWELALDFPPDYPFCPPKVRFHTPWHHRTLGKGPILVNSSVSFLSGPSWTPYLQTHGIQHVLAEVKIWIQDEIKAGNFGDAPLSTNKIQQRPTEKPQLLS